MRSYFAKKLMNLSGCTGNAARTPEKTDNGGIKMMALKPESYKYQSIISIFAGEADVKQFVSVRFSINS
jgi:hypothetical protein